MAQRAVIASTVLVTASFQAQSARAENQPDPVRISAGGFSWIKTEVTSDKTVTHRAKAHAKATRICTQTKAPNAARYASSADFSGDYPSAGAGGWVIRRCSDGSMDAAFIPAAVVPTRERIERLAQRATNRLPLPLPSPRFNPARPSSAGPATLVAIPTWFWVDGWAPVRQRTRAGGVWAEVVATPVAAIWFPGDGSAPVRCAANEAWSPDAAPTSCEHIYARSSAGQPANAYRARVVVTWRVSWTGSGGRSGSLPLMQRQSTFPIAVAERQTVVTVGGQQ